MLGVFITPVDSFRISLGMGLKDGGSILRWLCESCGLQLKQEAQGSIPIGYPGVFSSSWLTNVDGMRCSSTAWMLSI